MADAATTLALQLFARLGAEAQHLRRDEGADAIVAGARDVDVAVKLLPADDVGDEIADRDPLLGLLAIGRADVDEEFVQLRHFLLLAAVLHVDGQRADDAEHLAVAPVDMDPLAAREAGIVPADAAELDEAVVVDVLDLKRDLVGVALDHDLGRALRD